MKKERFKAETRPLALKENMITGENYRFTVLTPSLIRMEYSENGIFEDRASQIVFFRDFPKTQFECTEKDGKLVVLTEELTVEYIVGKPFAEDTLSVKLRIEPASLWHFGDDFEDLGGTARTLDGAYGEVPLCRGICSRTGFSVMDDTGSMMLDESGWISPRQCKGVDIYFFGYGYRYLDAVKDFYRLTGAPTFLPAYAFGNWWSRYHEYTQEEYQDLISRFEEEDIPFSVGVIDMDWHLVKGLPEGVNGWTGYTWNEELFPDYKAFLKFLKAKNLKTALNLHPALGVRKHEAMYKEMAEAMGIDPESGETVKFDIISPKFMENYFDILHHPYEETGVDFWWMDWQQGTDYWWIHEPNKEGKLQNPLEAVDPLWMLNHLHILDISRDGKRPVFFSRFSGPGSQRYSIGFSGDTMIDWDSLKFQPYFTSTASNIGYSWWSHDIGGHMGGYRDNELTIRWMQFGVFSPINRLHSTKNIFLKKEPWAYEERYSVIMKDLLRLRHSLFPYIYTMNYRAHTDLTPLVQPMYYPYPKKNDAYEAKNQYMFGSELMVSPITEKSNPVTGMGKSTTWLPEGDWYDFFDGTRYHSEKGRKIDNYRTLDKMPVFAKSGAIVPMAKHITGDNRLVNFEDMEVCVFPGASNSFVMYEDEGDYNNYKNGAYAKTEFSLLWDDKCRFTIGKAEGDLSLIPEKRRWTIKLRGFYKDIETSLTIGGKSAEYDVERCNKTHTLSLTFTASVDEECIIEIKGDKLINDNSDALERVLRILQCAEEETATKKRIWEFVNSHDDTLHNYITCMYNECGRTSADLVGSIKELLTLERGEYEV